MYQLIIIFKHVFRLLTHIRLGSIISGTLLSSKLYHLPVSLFLTNEVPVVGVVYNDKKPTINCVY